MIIKSMLVGATAIAIALTSFDLRPAAAAPLGGPAIGAAERGATDFSAQRKRKRGYRGNPAVPLAAFGAIIGTIGAVAAANSRRDYYERPYYGPAILRRTGLRLLRCAARVSLPCAAGHHHGRSAHARLLRR